MSQHFSGTENRILGAVARLDDFLMNPLFQGHSGTAPESSRNVFSLSQGTNDDESQSNPDSEVGLFNNQITQNSGPEDRHDMVRGIQRERERDREIERESLCGRDMRMFSGKQKKNRSSSQPHFRSENTLATIEIRQILSALQLLANNNNSANFHNNIDGIPKMPKSLTTTMPTFDGKSEKFKLFEDLFQMSLKIHKQLTEEDKICQFESLMRGDALQTFENNDG